MSGMHSPIGVRIWHGDLSALDELEEAYLRTQDLKELFAYACGLYSFRYYPQAALALDKLERYIRLNEETILSPGRDAYFGSDCLDRADMLTTYYLWFRNRRRKDDVERIQLMLDTQELCRQALARYEESGGKAHTYCLLGITYMTLSFDNPELQKVLAKVIELAPTIEDPQQRSRVYRGLGRVMRTHLYMTSYNTLRGFYWGIRACGVRNIPFMVRAKSFAALLGIGR